MGEINLIKIGTRGSALALVQTDLVINEINRKYPDIVCEKVIIHTTGDKILNQPLIAFGGKGVFVTEFEDALMSHKIDLAVHSAKDMPTEIPKGLQIVGTLPREDAREVLITKKGFEKEGRKHITIGTSSARRQIQIRELYQNVICKDLRGNVTTRLEKLKNGMYDGIILAAAGIKRLQLEKADEFDYQYFEYESMIPCGGQGIIAVEGRINDKVSDLLQTISDRIAFIELEIERGALNLLGAGCHEAIGVISNVNGNEINVKIAKEKDNKMVRVEGKTRVCERFALIESLINQLLDKE